MLSSLHRVGLFDAAWDALAPGMTVYSGPTDAQNTQLLFSLLKSFRAVFVEESHPRVVADELFQKIMEGVLSHSRNALLSQPQDEGAHHKLDVLLDMINTFGDNLFVGNDQAEVGWPIAADMSLY